MALLLQNLENQTKLLRSFVADHPYTAGATALTVFLTRWVSKDYAAWLDIEAGGVPSNLYGYMMALIADTQSSPDRLGTSLYLKMMTDSIKSRSYFSEELPIRAGIAPVISKWCVPVRQISSHAARKEVKTLDSLIASTVSAYPSACLRAPSAQEGGGCDALWIRTSAIASSSSDGPDKAELYHFHDYDGSAHTTLSPADARLLLDRGWGIRHPLSGQVMFGLKKLLPANFVMVYAPRNEEEVKVHDIVARAAVEYALAGGK